MSVSGVFVWSLPRGQRLQLVEIGDRNCVCIVDSGVTFRHRVCARNVAQNRSCWTGQAMLFQRCGMSVFGVFVREYAAGSVLTSVRDW